MFPSVRASPAPCFPNQVSSPCGACTNSIRGVVYLEINCITLLVQRGAFCTCASLSLINGAWQLSEAMANMIQCSGSHGEVCSWLCWAQKFSLRQS